MQQHAFNVGRTADTGELLVTCAGMTAAPVIINRDTGAHVTLRPARIESSPWSITVADCFRSEHANAWWGELAGDPAATEANLTLVADGIARNAIVRWPAEPAAPVPAPAPKRRRVRRQPA